MVSELQIPSCLYMFSSQARTMVPSPLKLCVLVSLSLSDIGFSSSWPVPIFVTFPSQIHFPAGTYTLITRDINVKATSWRHIDVDMTLF